MLCLKIFGQRFSPITWFFELKNILFFSEHFCENIRSKISKFYARKNLGRGSPQFYDFFISKNFLFFLKICVKKCKVINFLSAMPKKYLGRGYPQFHDFLSSKNILFFLNIFVKINGQIFPSSMPEKNLGRGSPQF